MLGADLRGAGPGIGRRFHPASRHKKIPAILEGELMAEIMLIRRFEKPIVVDYLHEATIALGWCRKLYGVTPGIHFLAVDGRRCACIFDAPDAEAVRSVIRTGSRSEPEALWPCTVHPGVNDDGA